MLVALKENTRGIRLLVFLMSVVIYAIAPVKKYEYLNNHDKSHFKIAGL